MRRQDFVAWEGPSSIDGSPIAVIVTGLTEPSRNGKTGPMLQVWILRQDVHPWEAVKTGQDSAICGECPMRGTGNGELRACYVRVETGPSAIWRKYAKGGYPVPEPDVWERWVHRRDVRLGAYGEPTAAPPSVMHALAGQSRMWTGYTHRWAELSLAGKGEVWRTVLMASVESDQQAQDAMRLGWRPFLALPGDEPVPEHAFLCPAEREDYPLQCMDCGACAGTKMGGRRAAAVYPYVPMHGHGRKNYRRMLQVVS